MKSRITLLTLALAATFLTAATAQATDNTFQQVTANGTGEYLWTTAANWDQGHLPLASERAIIPTSVVCYVDVTTAVADRIRVEGTGLLKIKASSKLTIDSDDAAASEVVASGSEIQLLGSSAELAFTSHTAQLSGSGKVVGQNDAAKVTVATGITLTNQAEISGNLEISGAGNFTNSGVVDADASGTLKVAVAGTLADGSNADRWIVSANGAKLRFDSTLGTVSTLDGNFVMITGNASSQIALDHALTSNGRLQMAVGVLDVNADVTMGDDTSHFAEVTGGQVQVAAGAEFLHN